MTRLARTAVVKAPGDKNGRSRGSGPQRRVRGSRFHRRTGARATPVATALLRTSWALGDKGGFLCFSVHAWTGGCVFDPSQRELRPRLLLLDQRDDETYVLVSHHHCDYFRWEPKEEGQRTAGPRELQVPKKGDSSGALTGAEQLGSRRTAAKTVSFFTEPSFAGTGQVSPRRDDMAVVSAVKPTPVRVYQLRPGARIKSKRQE